MHKFRPIYQINLVCFLILMHTMIGCKYNKESEKIIYRDYKPLYWAGESFVEDGRNMSRQEKINTALVLIYYGIPIKAEYLKKIQVPLNVWQDKEFIFNIGEKANDSVWFYRHITTNEGRRIIPP